MKVSILGASGLIGQHCLQALVEAPHIESIYCLSRRSLGITSPKVKVQLGSLDNLARWSEDLTVDAAICCLGSTRKQAGSKEAFAWVDRSQPVLFARKMHERGCRRFHVVSSLGADAHSSSFYLQTKGLMEDELVTLGFASLCIYRPSLLLGQRSEKRLAEQLAARLYQRFERLYPRWLDAYRPIPAQQVARCIVRDVLAGPPGLCIRENRALLS